MFRTFSRSPLLAAFFCMAASVYPAGAATHEKKMLTVSDIYTDKALTTHPPQGMVWSPDGTRLTYLSSEGNLDQVEGSSGKHSVLVPKDKINNLSGAAINEKDKDHRARYGQSSYIWAPDSQHLLFDSDGQLWFYSPKAGTGLQIAQTGAGSGDDPKFSPDGQFVSYVREHNLYLRRLRDTQMPLRLTNTHEDTLLNGEVDWVYEEELDVRSNYFWSPDSRAIAYLQMNESGVPRYPLVDWIPTHASVDGQRYPQPGDANPSVRVGVGNVSNGKTVWLKVPLDSGNDYIPRFGWVNGRVVWVETLTRDHKHKSLFFCDAVNGSARQVLTETDDKFFDEAYDLTFTSAGFLWSSWRDGHTQVYLYTFDPNNPMGGEAKLQRQVTTGDGEVDAVEGVDATRNTVYYLSNEGDPRQQQIWAVGMDGTGKRKVSTAPGVHSPIFSPNAKYFVDTASNTMTQPTVSVCHEDGDCHFFWKSPSASAYELGEPIHLTLKASDGTALYASLLLPPGNATAGSVPLITNPYGGPHAQTVTDRWIGGDLFDQVLAQHGFAVLHVDNRGMGGRGRVFAQAAYRNFGPVQLSDQLAAVDQVLAQYPELDGKRLGWWGWSWGGAFTLYSLTHSDRFRAGVSVAPVTDWHNYDSIYTERYMGLPSQNSDEYRDDSVVTHADKLKGRLLIAHGTGDDNVHLTNTIQFIQKLIDADLPYDLQLYPRKTHSIAGVAARTQLFNRILWHFDTYLMHADANSNAPGAKEEAQEGVKK